jgi:hypothetical protein
VGALVEAKIIPGVILMTEARTGPLCLTLFVLNVELRVKFLLDQTAEKKFFAVSVLRITGVVPETQVSEIPDAQISATNRCLEPLVTNVVKAVKYRSAPLKVNPFCVVIVLPDPETNQPDQPETLSFNRLTPNWIK